MALDDAHGCNRQDRDHDMTDGQGSSLTYAVLKQPTLGWVTNNSDGTFSFDPGTDFQNLAVGETRQVTFDYQASDGWGGTEAARAIVTVTGTADGTLAIDVSYGGTLDHDGAQPSDVSAGGAPEDGADFDSSGLPLVDTPESDPPTSHAPAALADPDTEFDRRFDPPHADVLGERAPTRPKTDTPTAEVARQEFGQEPLASAPPAGSDAQRYTVLAQPSEGCVQAREDGTFDFLPDPDFPELAVGEMHQVTFTCQASDQGGAARTVIVALTVAGTSDGLVACDVSFRRAQRPATPQQEVVAETGESGSTSDTLGVDEGLPADHPAQSASGTSASLDPPEATVPAVDTSAPPELGGLPAGSALHEGHSERAGPSPDFVAEESGWLEFDLNPAGADTGLAIEPTAGAHMDPGNTVGSASTVTGPGSDSNIVAEDDAYARSGMEQTATSARAAGEDLWEHPGSGGMPDGTTPPSDPGSALRPDSLRAEPQAPAIGAEIGELPGSAGEADGPAPVPADPENTPRPDPLRAEPPPPVIGAELRERPGYAGEADSPTPAPADPGNTPPPDPVDAHALEDASLAPAGHTDFPPAGMTDFTLSNDTVSETFGPGAFVGQVVVASAVNTGGFIYDLQRDAGGRFDINPRTGKITVAEGARLDHRAEASHEVLIQVIDASGVSCRKTCTIKVLSADADQSIDQDASSAEADPQGENVPEILVKDNEARDPALGEAKARGGLPGRPVDPSPMGGGDAMEETSGGRHDTLRLDGVTGGPDDGGWTLELTEGVVVARKGDHILLSGNSAGTIGLDGATAKVAFRGIERLEW